MKLYRIIFNGWALKFTIFAIDIEETDGNMMTIQGIKNGNWVGEQNITLPTYLWWVDVEQYLDKAKVGEIMLFR